MLALNIEHYASGRIQFFQGCGNCQMAAECKVKYHHLVSTS